MSSEQTKIIMDEIDIILNNFIDRIFELSQRNLINGEKIDTGTLFKTGNINRAYLEKEIVYPVNYADIVEYGRNPGGFPPVEAVTGSIEILDKWTQRKLGIRNKKERKRIAFAIAKAIEQRGIDPFPFLQPALEQAIREYEGR